MVARVLPGLRTLAVWSWSGVSRARVGGLNRRSPLARRGSASGLNETGWWWDEDRIRLRFRLREGCNTSITQPGSRKTGSQ
jgi:hypothetical protein